MELQLRASSPARERVDVSWASDVSTLGLPDHSRRFAVSVSDASRRLEWLVILPGNGQRSFRLDTSIFDADVQSAVTVRGYRWYPSADDGRLVSLKVDQIGSATITEAVEEAIRERQRAVGTASRRTDRDACQTGNESFLGRVIRKVWQWIVNAVRWAYPDTEDRRTVRLEDSGEPFEDMPVECHLDRGTKFLTGVVSWTWNGQMGIINVWQVTLVNLTWIQGDRCTYDQWMWMIEVDAEQRRSFELPVQFRRGNRYHVTVRGIRWPTTAIATSDHQLPVTMNVVSKGTAEFRSGEVLSKADVEALCSEATNYSNLDYRNECIWFYRNKSKAYFDKILNEQGGVMTPRLKDGGGDPRCPINGEISGLFFSAKANPGGSPIPCSPFGNTRLLIEAREALNLYPNVYFADFYCTSDRGPHYVTLVLTSTGSEADKLCKQRLPRLDLNDPRSNPFLYFQNGQLYVGTSCMVEVFITEPINIESMIRTGLCKFEYWIPVIGSGSSTQGGIRKNWSCKICWVSRGLCCSTLGKYGVF